MSEPAAPPTLPPAGISDVPEHRMKISDLIIDLVHMMRQHGDLEVAVMLNDNIKKEETQIDDVSTSIFQQQVVLSNTVVERRFLGIVGTIREEWERNVSVQPRMRSKSHQDRPQSQPAVLSPL